MKNESESSSRCQSLLESMQAELDKIPTLSQCSQRRQCIYRVPKLLRKVKEEAYTPVLVSIGPFHHKDEKLLHMDTHKLVYLRSFMEHSETNADLKSYLEIIKDKEWQIRECYAESIPLTSDEFVRMVLIDSIFIIELFRTRMIMMPFTLGELTHDSFTHLACMWLVVDESKVQVDPITNEAARCCHLLDLLRSNYLPSQQEHQFVDIDHSSILCPTAMSLYEAGVTFLVKAASDKPCSLLDIDFNKEKGILTIPNLKVEDDTESSFRNLMAFEQSHYRHTYLADYHYFMDCLINTKEDVKLLANAGIIDNLLGSDKEVSCLINSLGSNITSSAYYARITKQLNNHCNKRWNRYRATLKHNYFNHPWAVLSVIYAVILLLLTIAQLLTGILAVPGVKK